MTFWTLSSNLLIILALQFLREWTIIQLSVLIVLNVITILIALPKNVFKTAAMRITTIGTEIGFIIINILFLVMHFLENSGSYQVRLILSWAVVGVNAAIILFQFIVKIVEFIRLRRKKKQEKRKQKQEKEDSRIKLRRPHKFSISIQVDPNRSWNRFRSVHDTVRNLK